MEYILIAVIIIIAVLLILIVLIQNPKGGGLSASFGGVGNQVFGANKSTDFVEKATWYLAAGLLVITLASVWVTKGQIGKTNAAATASEKTEVEENMNKYQNLNQPVAVPNNNMNQNSAPVQDPNNNQ